MQVLLLTTSIFCNISLPIIANQTITLDAVSAKVLLKELEHLEEIRKTLLRIIPESFLSKGSDLWWDKSDLEALEDREGQDKFEGHEGLEKK